MSDNPEIGLSVDVDGIATNYHRSGSGPVVLLVHGSGPGVSAFANWRLTMPGLAERFDVIAPDIVGFGFTDRPEGFDYSLDVVAGPPARLRRRAGAGHLLDRRQQLRRRAGDLDGGARAPSGSSGWC